ncbi:hypothetical protein [Leisingera sp. ANG-DT]|uniref:hypothetical protein n=1 Tax=Leisingera sp. ANG-DT TaxID=1577897 RepID=UPI001269BD95|nr:hypothetical protein [Leisingera sp. ANG-DT]
MQAQGDWGELFIDQLRDLGRLTRPARLHEVRRNPRQAACGFLQVCKPGIPWQLLPFHLPCVTGDDHRQVISFVQGLGRGHPHPSRRPGFAGQGKYHGVACTLIDAVVSCDLLLIADQQAGSLICLLQCLQPQNGKQDDQPGPGQEGGQQLVPQ